MTPFDFLKHINEPGGNANLLDNEEVERDYKKNMFMINRGLAQSIDTIMYANEANKQRIENPHMHYGLMFNSIKKRKRWSAWAKKGEDVEGLDTVMEYYQVSREKALEYMALLTPQHIEAMKQLMDPGGGDKPTKVATKEKKK